MKASKDEISAVLDDIIDSFDRTHPIGNKAKRKIAFAPIANRIKHLEFLINQEIPHMRENVWRIHSHYGAAFGVEVTNGHSYEQHIAWADRAINAIRRELKKSESEILGEGL